MMDTESKIQTLYDYISKAEHIVFFGGAGVSTESGIPDFRSKDGLYNQHDVQFDKYQPEYLLSHSCLMNESEVYYEFHRQKMDTRNIEPNAAHKYLAKLEQSGKRVSIVTQNIDGLHQKAGSKVVHEIHGSALRNYCMRCHKQYDVNFIFDSQEKIPHCTCGGVVRPDITLYEESLPDQDVNLALKALASADLMIIGGTSLAVYPAASFVNYFKGKYLAVINESEIRVPDVENVVVLHERIGEVFSKLDKMD